MTNPNLPGIQDIKRSVDAVQKWVEDRNYCGYEPFDGLSSVFRPLTFHNLFAERLLMQLIRQSPFNLRPLFGVTKKESTKGRGYMAWGYLAMYHATRQKEYLNKATACLDWLDHHKAPKYAKHSWSNHFDFSSRGGGYTKDDPIIVWTALICQAYLEAYEQTREPRWLKIAESACGWIMDLPREQTEKGACISYLAHVQSSIHNSNMLGAAVLARTAKHNGNQEYLKVARSGMEYSCSRQRPDGSWPYGEHPKYSWIDNFHTGYNLNSLKCYMDYSGDEAWRHQFRHGLEYYKQNFFEADGCPKYYHNRKFPVDIQCAAQSIESLAEFSEEDPECLELARRVAGWTIANMQDAKGYFYYRQYPAITSRIPMLHWGQATTFRGMALLYDKLSLSGGPAAVGAKVTQK